MHPRPEEVTKLKESLDQFRWYYNAVIQIVFSHYENILDNKKYYYNRVRDLIRKYVYDKDTRSFYYDEEANEFPRPPWWKNVHNRIVRGAIKKFTGNLNSAISNYLAGNIDSFEFDFKSSKDLTAFMLFEDNRYPSFIDKIESVYTYSTHKGPNGKRKRKTLLFSSLPKSKGFEIIQEKPTGRFYLHLSVPYDWFPSDDKRLEKQDRLNVKKDRIISLDPGIRKFMVGYDPSGQSIVVAKGASKILAQQLLEVDQIIDPKQSFLKWKKIKNMIKDLHWKTISHLIDNYDTILLPEFKVSQMLKSKKLSKTTKRLLNMFSFYKFKVKLAYKCVRHNKKLVIVNESYTSKTCGVCGHLNDVGSKETFQCSRCKTRGDRDALAARNILIKNVVLR